MAGRDKAKSAFGKAKVTRIPIPGTLSGEFSNSDTLSCSQERVTILTMSEEATALLKKALTLPVRERADLASSLIDSLDTTCDENVEAAWQEEIARRIETLRRGEATMIPWEEVRKKARKILHEETH